MLTPNIAAQLRRRRRDTSSGEAELVARGKPQGSETCGQAALFATDAESFLAIEDLQAEVFGASSLIVRCADAAEMRGRRHRASKAS